MQGDRKPDFICSRTAWAGLYLSPDSPHAQATHTICNSCGGRQLLTSYLARANPGLKLRYRPTKYGPRCRAIQANPRQMRWARRQPRSWWNEGARVDDHTPEGHGRKQRPWETDVGLASLEAGLEWPRDYLACAPCCAPGRENVPWDGTEVYPGRGVQVLAREEVEEAALAAAAWESAVRFSRWGEEIERIELRDIEGSYVVRCAKPRRRRCVVGNRPARTVVELLSLGSSDCEDDGFELVSNPGSWCVVDEPGDNELEY